MYGIGGGKFSLAIFAGVGLMLILFIGIFLKPDKQQPGISPEAQQVVIEQARKESYDQGYAEGYDQGYAAAEQEIGSTAFTTYGITGFVLGFALSMGGLAYLNRKTLESTYQTLRSQHELHKAFRALPPNLSPQVQAMAEQIARTYVNVLNQFRTDRGYLITQYAEQWRPKLEQYMGETLHLLERIQELETARNQVNVQQVQRTITELEQTAREAADDDTRQAALKSLQRATQTQQDIETTQQHLKRCTTTLRGVNGALESMRLKLSNLKVNTKDTDVLEALSSDLEIELNSLEEVVHELTS